jgi:hypothetical protein
VVNLGQYPDRKTGNRDFCDESEHATAALVFIGAALLRLASRTVRLPRHTRVTSH